MDTMKFDESTDLFGKTSSPQFKQATRYTPQADSPLIVARLISLGALVFLALSSAAAIAFEFAWKWALLFTAAGTAILFLAVLSYAFKNDLLWIVEEVFNYDRDGDGIIGPPVVRQTHFSLPKGASSARLGTVNVPPHTLIEWCKAATNNESLSFARWESRFADPDGKKGRENYTEFRDWLLSQGYATGASSTTGMRINWQNQEAADWIYGFAVQDPDGGEE
jgi:hypothetical protein